MLYILTILQLIWVLLVIGSISSKPVPADPSTADHWLPEVRLFRMFFSIVDITMAIPYLVFFHHTVKMMNIYKENTDGTLLSPSSQGGQVALKLFYWVLVGVYLGLGAFICSLYQGDTISYSTFVLPIYISVIAIHSICPLVICVYSLKNRKLEFPNSRAKLRCYMLIGGFFIWSFCRVYRGIHGVIDRDVIFNELLAQESTLWLVIHAILFAIGNQLPYLCIPIIRDCPEKRLDYVSMIHRNSDLTLNSNEG